MLSPPARLTNARLASRMQVHNAGQVDRHGDLIGEPAPELVLTYFDGIANECGTFLV